MRLKSVLVVIALAFAAFTPTIARADLLGSEVTGTLLFPNETAFFQRSDWARTRYLRSSPRVSGGHSGVRRFLAVSGSQIIWKATLPETYATAAFNGFNLQFTGAPTITKVTLDPASTILPVPFTGFPISSSSGFSFNGSNVLFNLAGDTATAGQELILDVQTSPSAVPEPTSVILLGSGLIAGAGFLRRKFMPL